jgi:Flp pilus assembly pilin Flp
VCYLANIYRLFLYSRGRTHYRRFVSKKNNGERGVATVEYGITIGVVALVAAAMFAQTSAGINGVWRHATTAATKSPAASATPAFLDCMANAHGDSKVCSNTGY